MSARTVAVVSAGLSVPSSTRLLADQLAAATVEQLAQQGTDTAVRVIEVRDLGHDLVNNLLAGFPSAQLSEAIEAVTGADALIAVTPIFSGSYNGLFKSFFDVLPRDAMADLPVLIAATGGTARHSLALEYAVRPLFAYLRAPVVPTAVFAAAEDWGGDEQESTLRTRINRAAAELAEEIRRREPRKPAGPFALSRSFEELLGGE
ncbi:FMN reductase [Melissospora conviva]|uniref:FMN reductase n=1 Tax=Melissospora conviva TaxID=3388432 RepID=UPI003C1AECDA